MTNQLDKTNIALLALLQHDASVAIEKLAEQVSLSRNACWRRIRAMEESGLIRGRVVLIDPAQVGLPLVALVMVRTNLHEAHWLERFRSAVLSMPEVVAAWRMSGDLDYVLRVRIPTVAGYDEFYQRLIAQVPMSDVSASFVLEEIKETTELPLKLPLVR
jgi:Lrp/AsnC family transcriptional regulator